MLLVTKTDFVYQFPSWVQEKHLVQVAIRKLCQEIFIDLTPSFIYFARKLLMEFCQDVFVDLKCVPATKTG